MRYRLARCVVLVIDVAKFVYASMIFSMTLPQIYAADAKANITLKAAWD